MPVHPPISSTDSELLALASKGDEAAFTELYNRYWGKAFNFIFRVVKQRDATEELVSDIFTRLWVGRELLKDIESLDAFLYSVCRNRGIDFLRSVSRRERLQQAVARQVAQGGTSLSENADQKLLDSETQRIILEAVQELSPQRARVFTMSRMQYMSQEQIAETLGLSVNTVKTTMNRALKDLRRNLSEKGIGGAALLYYWLIS
jgi:RNA polymerase sigma-70 factor (family 1)